MSLNWVEIDQVLSELPLEGCFLQNVRQADYHHLYLEFYRPGRSIQLLVCLAPGKTRLHEVRKRPPTLARPPRFVEFLRSRVVGGQVIAARQLGRERHVLLRFQTLTEVLDLWIRLWTGAANILVTDAQHKILEAAFRRPKSNEVTGAMFDPEAQFADALAEPPRKEFRLRDFDDLDLSQESAPTYNRRLELFYAAEGGEDVEKLRDQALRLIDRRLNAIEAARERSKQKLTDYERQEDWKVYADVLTSGAYALKKGDQVFEGEDYRDGSTFVLDLDSKLSPHENAQVYYKKYQKARDGVELVREELAGQDSEETEWLHHQTVLETADVSALKAFLEKNRVVRNEVQKTKSEKPGLEFQSGPFAIYVGRSAKENDALLRRYVKGNDVWMHTRDVPGGYVFIRTVKGKSVPLEVLLDAGNLAVWYSKARTEGRADLYYTPVKYLRRAQNGPLGLVLPTQEKNLTLRIERSKIERLHRAQESS